MCTDRNQQSNAYCSFTYLDKAANVFVVPVLNSEGWGFLGIADLSGPAVNCAVLVLPLMMRGPFRLTAYT